MFGLEFFTHLSKNSYSLRVELTKRRKKNTF